MARLLTVTIVTDDEQYMAESNVADKIKAHLDKLEMDTYNNIYVVTVHVDTIDETPEDKDDDDDA